jgi:hypothetical protein
MSVVPGRVERVALLFASLLSLPVAAEDSATEGKKVITGMLITGLIFVGVIALGQLSRWARHRRH